jgi:hypothetical protein
MVHFKLEVRRRTATRFTGAENRGATSLQLTASLEGGRKL